jgi:CoA-dependent NAD(P)H sulfur oxidoreductase
LLKNPQALLKKLEIKPNLINLINTMEIKHYNYLIIGADAAGLSAAVQIRSVDSNATIGILEKGEIISYGSCGLPYAIQGIIPDFNKLIHFTAESFHEKNRADVHLLTKAISADFTKKNITALILKSPGDGNNPSKYEGKKNPSESDESDEYAGKIQYSYDKLLIATGAVPIRIPGLDYSSGFVFSLKSVPDGRAIRRFIDEKKPKKVIMIGGGYIGLEMADVLTELGIKVTILDMSPEPIFRMPTAARKAVFKKMKDKGIEFIGGISINASRVNADMTQIILETDKNDFPADMVIAATGIKPATDFLDGTILSMQRGAIETDDQCQTNIAYVYAAGDCAMVNHRLLKKNVYMPLGSTANKQGRIAGQNMAGLKIHFPGILGTQVFRFFDQAIAKTGLSAEEAESIGLPAIDLSANRSSKAGYYPGGIPIDIHLTVHKETGVILGGLYIGPAEQGSMIDTIGVMAQSGMKAADIAYFDSAYAPPVAPVWNALISAAGKFGREGD